MFGDYLCGQLRDSQLIVVIMKVVDIQSDHACGQQGRSQPTVMKVVDIQ